MTNHQQPSAQFAAASRLADEGRYAQSRDALMRILARNPRDADASMLMCFVCGKLGDFVRAVYFAEVCIKLLPDDPRAYANLVMALTDLGAVADALSVARQAAARMPNAIEISVLMVGTLTAAGRTCEALRCAEAALERWPDLLEQRQNAASLCLNTGRADLAAEHWRKAIALDPPLPNFHSGLLGTLNYCENASHEEMLAAQRGYAERMALREGPSRDAWNLTRDPDRILRIGIVSPDLRKHATSHFIIPFLTHHDRSRFEITCYSTATKEDRVTDELRSMVSRWRHVPRVVFRSLRDLIVSDQIDVLIDLAGHTLGNALGTLHHKPAPIQMTWIGYPASTGLASVDYRIVDSLTDPPDAPWPCTETPLRLDPCFLTWRPPEGAPEVAPAPRTSNGFITFGSFSSPPKLTDATFRLWAGTLNAVPGSRFIYKSGALGDPEVVDMLRERFARSGADPERITFDTPGADALAVLPAYARVDISLDTFPYHGTTTTCESLWMGVPMVALRGGTSAARVNCSLLSAAGLADLVADTAGGYIRTAAALANDHARLDALRSSGPGGLRAGMERSVIRDEAGHTRRLETAIRACWRAWCARGSPS